tara:strand:- start:155 stop:790 length:636 start_codon:yes stop_codon:yes gene_type:complete
MKKITIIDYGCGNILNLARAIEFVGCEAEITRDRKKIINSSNLILPGVGAFGNAMKKLEEYELTKTIIEYAQINKKPLLGICLGMQVLLKVSYEFGVHQGLGLIDGEVIKISTREDKKIKIPHIGWNEVYPISNKKWDNEILNDSLIGKSFYFIHSYIGVTKEKNSTIAVCDYFGNSIPSVISKENIFGCQFHPEKSGKNGLSLLKNFCKI